MVTLDKCVQNFARFTGCSLGEAIRCATYNPAKCVQFLLFMLGSRANTPHRCLGIQAKKGTLTAEADADLVVLDRVGNIVSTWIKGREVWKRG